MAIEFLNPETSVVFSAPADLPKGGKFADALKNIARDIPTSDQLTGVELRLLPPFVKDNNTEPFLVFPGFAKLYCLTIVVSDINNQLVGGIDLQGFPRIGDNEHLPINKTIFYWQQNETDHKPPKQVHTLCSVIKSKKALRETGKIMADLKNDQEYQTLMGTVTNLASSTSPVGVALDIITQVAGIVGKYLGNVEDKPVGTVINSFTDIRGDFDHEGVRKHTFNATKVDFEMEVIVRAQRHAERSRTRSLEDGQEEVEVQMEPLW
ncbi:hypothetical protein ACFOTA_24220 [Chitinophaga sp. GCM10012297]|uniref:Uncharacterized protein n=1 Tax=Chitinophaga chungangae TaxID=2821488 RepID=A0ABS3YKW0_9BACT|nr:hypothetical protein [Chitinophaga chungangae]MBO9155339.1 hypothetical protein [Chitinophaga chungangae]